MHLALVFSTGFPAILLGVSVVGFLAGDDGERLLRLDHFARVRSTMPALAARPLKSISGKWCRQAPRCEPYRQVTASCCSSTGQERPPRFPSTWGIRTIAGWVYLARAGFDVFGMDMTGYGRSTRPEPMNDPCNLSHDQQLTFVPSLLAVPCAPSYPHQMTIIASDWKTSGLLSITFWRRAEAPAKSPPTEPR